MISFPINLSMPWTCFSNVSMKVVFMDTFYGRVHDVDMNESNQSTSRKYAVIAEHMEVLAYGR